MRTDENLKIICDQLRQNYGDLHASARRAGLSLDFITNWIKDDQEAAKEIEEAQRVGYMGLESVAIARGVHGVQEDVFYKGEVVGQKTNYSDTLLSKVMDARIPAYKKGSEGGNTFTGPTQINIMPRAENFDQWLEMKRTTLADRAEQKLIAAQPVKVPEILQGDFVEVSPMSVLEGLL